MRTGSALAWSAGLVLVLAATASAKEWPTKVPSEVERGRELYQRHCQACHGEKGAGDGLMAVSIRAAVPNFQAGFGKREQDELVKAVLHGKGVMPGFETSFTKEDAEKVIKFMSNVGNAPSAPTKGEKKPEAADDDNEAGGG